MLPEDLPPPSDELLRYLERLNRQHCENEATAHGLLASWRNPDQFPKGVSKPVCAEWRSPDGTTRDAIAVWTPRFFSGSWAYSILDWIEEVCVEDRDAWRYQPTRERYRSILIDFFSSSRPASVFHMVTITPFRLPRKLWTPIGRPALIEVLVPDPPTAPREQPIRTIGLVCPVRIDLSDILWIERGPASKQNQRLVISRADRSFCGRPSIYRRVYEAHQEADATALRDGFVPAVAEASSGGGWTERVWAPMIQLFKIYSSGKTDFINIELSRGSGRLADLRWSSQDIFDIIIHDPHYAQVITEALLRGRKLIR